MTHPCLDFLTMAGIKVEFDNICANAGLTRLVTRRVPQYPKLTYYFVNWFRYNHRASTIEFRIYDDVLIMPLAEFCDIIGVRNVGKTARMNSQPYELKVLFDSLCSQDPKDIHRGKISSILFPHIRYFTYFIARGVLYRDNPSNIAAPDIAILATALSGDNTYNNGGLIARRLVANGKKGSLFGVIYATLILERLERTAHVDDVPFPFISFGNLVCIMRFG